ncbi:MAG: exodeoxyribonuclease III [Thiohalomonadaceae bacterium]
MKIISVNVNGIRSAAGKGLFEWLAGQEADVVCVQETKAQEHQLDPAVFRPAGLSCHYFDALKKGYSGTALFCRKPPERVVRGLGFAGCDDEGRYLQANYGNLSIASLYLPSGSAGAERQAAKYAFMDAFLEVLARLRKDGREYIICGDWNIAHRNIDLKNWRSNQKNSGFLPEERAWLDEVFEELGWVDGFRVVNQEPEQYTWWSNRGQAWAKNVGWRIDYQIISPGLRERVKAASIYKEQRFSDHAPLIIEYAGEL